VWGESASGGFSKKKIDPESKLPLKSPEKQKDIQKKDSIANNTTIGSIKKTIVKLNTLPPTKEAPQSNLVQ